MSCDLIVIDGHPYRWRDIQRLRKEQVAAWKAEQQARRPLLIEDLPAQCRPTSERTLKGRYHAAQQYLLFTPPQ